MNFKVGYHMGNLCDALLLTPIFKAGNPLNFSLDIIDDEVAKNKAALFEGLCDVNITNDAAPPFPNFSNDVFFHKSQFYLNMVGRSDVNFTPYVKVTEEEKVWAREFLKSYSNPIIYIPNNSCSFDKNNVFAQMRTFTKEMNDIIIPQLSQKYTLLQFGVNSKFYKTMRAEINEYNGVINIENLNLRQLAACYSVIGKGFCSDTGDPYLMLAVGGKIIEIVPMYNPQIYPYYQYIYNNEKLWKDEKMRARYFCMSNWKDSLNFIDFDF